MNPVLSFCESEPIRLTSNLHSIVLAISNSDKPYMAVISRDTGISDRTVQSVVNQLASKKYIEINAMSKKKIISLTDAGRNLAIFCEAL